MLKIVTLNLNYYVEKHGPWEVRKKLVLQVLRERDPDIILLQAVAKHPDAFGGKDQALQLSEELAFNAHYFQEAHIQADGLVQGSAVIAKHPMMDKSFLRLTLIPGLDDTNHRVVLKTTFQGNNGTLDVYNAHFSWVSEQAQKNVAETTAFMGTENAMALLGGDLNTTRESEVFLPFTRRGLIDAWQNLHGDREGNTFESDDPSIRIDYFWLSPPLVPLLNAVSVIAPPSGSGAGLSDHFGLLMELNTSL